MPQYPSPTPTVQGSRASLNITAPTVIKASPGRAFRLTVLVAGTAAGSVNDCSTTAAAAVTNQVGVAPTTAGTTTIDFPCLVGITVVPGAGQTLAITYT